METQPSYIYIYIGNVEHFTILECSTYSYDDDDGIHFDFYLGHIVPGRRCGCSAIRYELWTMLRPDNRRIRRCRHGGYTTPILVDTTRIIRDGSTTSRRRIVCVGPTIVVVVCR